MLISHIVASHAIRKSSIETRRFSERYRHYHHSAIPATSDEFQGLTIGHG